MAERTCHNCVYAVCDPGLWLRCVWRGETLVPQCANHPASPGRLVDVTGVPCRNYRPRPAVPNGDGVRMIALGDGCYTYVDAADYEWLSRWNWHLDSGYAARYDGRKAIYMHRQIMQPPKGKIVDHIDGNRANNCRCNLRICTRAENSRNKRKHSGSSSVFKGVSYCKEKRRWLASCRHKAKPRRIGYFDDEAEAARAYDRKAVELFKGFARLNFPEEWPPERRAEVYAQAEKAESEQTKESRKKPKKEGGKKTPSRAKPQGRKGRKRETSSKRTTASKGPPRRRGNHQSSIVNDRSKAATGHKSRSTAAKPRATPSKPRATKKPAAKPRKPATRATGHGSQATARKPRNTKKPSARAGTARRRGNHQ